MKSEVKQIYYTAFINRKYKGCNININSIISLPDYVDESPFFFKRDDGRYGVISLTHIKDFMDKNDIKIIRK